MKWACTLLTGSWRPPMMLSMEKEKDFGFCSEVATSVLMGSGLEAEAWARLAWAWTMWLMMAWVLCSWATVAMVLTTEAWYGGW